MLTKPDIDWLKSEFLPSLADAVEDKLRGKLDDLSQKLDGFVGDIKDKREVQEMHAKQHSETDETLEDVQKRLVILEKQSPISN